MPMYGSYDPFSGTYAGISAYNPSYVTGQNSLAQTQAQSAYYQAMTQNQSDALAFQKAQAAFTDAMSLGSAYGYSMGGNPYNFGSMMLPSAGTPLQSTMNQMGYAGAIPGFTGYNTGPTASYQQQLASQAATAAGITGQYVAPGATPYSPGTFVQVPTDQLPAGFTAAGGNYAIGYVTPSGQIQQLSQQQAQQMGYNPANAQQIGFQQFEQLVAAPPQQTPQQSLQSIQAYQQMNNAANQNALATANATGMYSAPGQILAPGYNNAGQSFYTIDPATQQQYLSYYKDPQSAMQAWVNDTNAALNTATPGGQYQGVTGAGTPTETLAAQNQYFNQAQQLAQTYGQYYAPTAPGQTPQAGVNAPQAGQTTQSYQQFQQQAAQSYLQLLSQLQGPADYGRYLNVLGSTPGGIQSLVGAAAGNYVPGTGTTGQAPQAQTLQNLVGAATGYAGGGTGANATSDQSQQQGTGTGGTASPGGMNYQNYLASAQGLPAPNQIAPQAFGNMTPSQQQMMGGMYTSLGYAQPDINALYQQSLPKYAAGSSAGSFKLV